MNILMIFFIVFLICLAIQFFGRFFFDYKITPESIEAIAFTRIRWEQIPYKEIEDVRKISVLKSFFIFGTHYGNKIFTNHVVWIRKKTGIVKNIFATPDDIDSFISQAKEYLQ